MKVRTESFVLGNYKFVVPGNIFYFGELWDGNGYGEELLESGCIGMYDEDQEQEVVVDFEVIERDIHILKTLVRVIDIR